VADDRAHPGGGSVSDGRFHGTTFQRPYRLHLQTFIHRKGRYPTRAEKRDIAERRDRMRSRIDRFHEMAMKHYDDRATQYLTGETSFIPFHDDAEFGMPDVPPLEAFRSPEGIQPERMKLALPSSFPVRYLHQLALHDLQEQELQLRRGQANDALQAIRLLIGQKSFQFTSNMRNVDPAASVTRPRAAIEALGRSISAHRRVYTRCRAAMVVLNMPPSELANVYRHIEDRDIRTDTSIQEPNRPGSARQTLSWIFTASQGQSTGNDFMEECVSSIHPPFPSFDTFSHRLSGALAPCPGARYALGRGIKADSP
jgi:hypothetical protein